MHILLLTYEFHPTNGGVGNATLALARALRQHRADRITVVVCRSWWPTEEKKLHEIWDGFEIFRIKYTGLPEERRIRQSARSLICLFRLFIRIRSVNPDIVLSQRLYDLGWFAGLICRVLQIPSYAYAHGPDDIQHAESQPLRRRLNIWSFSLNRCVFVTNSAFREQLLRLDQTARIEIIPNVIDQEESPGVPPASRSAEDGLFHIACVGRLVEEFGIETKGFSYAVQAMGELPGTVLHIYGEGPHQSALVRIAEERRVSDRVQFHGKLDRETLHHELLRMNILLHPAIIEGLPMIILESMMIGLPVLASRVGGIPDILADNETGFLLAEVDSAAIVRRIIEIQSNPVLLADIRVKAKAFILEYSSPSRIAELLHLNISRTAQ